MGEGAVVCPLRIRWEKATGQLPGLEMIADTLTTQPPTGTGLIATRALLKILRLLAFHGTPKIGETRADRL